MGCAVVVFQEGLKKWAFDLGRFPIINLDLLHGVHTPVITSFCKQEEQSILTCKSEGEEQFCPCSPQPSVLSPLKSEVNMWCFQWKQTGLLQSRARILSSFLENLQTSTFLHTPPSKLFIPHQENMIGYCRKTPGFERSSKKIQP